ncbi:hypothetical protein HYZ82_00805 [Candidatus Nomurabacteria bacterium]|nr:hypothetical protein [Candidatus Nomurabacteria bacterium]
MNKIKNIIIFLGIGAVIFLAYYFFIKEDPETENLVSVTVPLSTTPANGGGAGENDFLTLLLSVKSIQLNDAIFSDDAFLGLDDSNGIILIGDGSEGRPNPFAPFGAEVSGL